MGLDHARWRAMGSDVEVIVVDGPAEALAWARRRIEQLEHRWSRFLPDSDVSRLNAAAGQPVEVDPDTIELVRVAVEAWRESGGSVNPTVLGAVIGSGYDRSFADLVPRDTAPSSGLRIVACTDIEVAGTTVTLPAGTGFDPGGIGKGLAADLVVDDLLAHGCRGACVNVGGDLRVGGSGPDGNGWTITIERPGSPGSDLVAVGLADGAIATSTTLLRRWMVGSSERHHLIDPATGEPTTSDLVQASTVTRRCWLAETYAKAILLAGSDRAFDKLPADVGAIAVSAHGEVFSTPSLQAFLGSAAAPRHLRPVEAS
jgi:thiamine biosynthesis lipoprotein